MKKQRGRESNNSIKLTHVFHHERSTILFAVQTKYYSHPRVSLVDNILLLTISANRSYKRICGFGSVYFFNDVIITTTPNIEPVIFRFPECLLIRLHLAKSVAQTVTNQNTALICNMHDERIRIPTSKIFDFKSSQIYGTISSQLSTKHKLLQRNS